MDNPLTPRKIQRLIQLAEDRSFNVERRLLLSEDDVKILSAQAAATPNRNRYESAKYESSSGILDLDNVEGFGESESIANMSLSKSTAFNPGEITGRSTGTEDPNSKSNMGLSVPRMEEFGRHSLGIESLANQMDKQTNEINDIMRHSIASSFSFHSKPNLTADEASLIAREAPIPFQTTHTQFLETSTVNSSTTNVSMGSYFKNRCPEFGNMLAKTESPNKSSFMMPSITEVSSSTHYDHKGANQPISIDDTLDSIPVRQPRAQQKLTDNSKIPVFKEPQRPKEKVNVPNKTPEKSQSKLDPTAFAHKAFLSSSKPTNTLLKNLQQSSLRLLSDDTESSENNSLSVSKIADYLERQSNVRVSEIMRLQNKKPKAKKQPLTELHMNTQRIEEEVQVTNLIDSKKGETASSASTVNTLIPLDKLNIKNVPEVVVTRETMEHDTDGKCMRSRSPASKSTDGKRTRSKSPSNKSQSTLSTVRDNYNSFKSNESPNSSKGLEKSNKPKELSPNIKYKELDKSVDWHEVLLQKQLRRVAKEQWAEVSAPPVSGFAGVSCAATITVTTLVDSWLTAKLEFDTEQDDNNLNIELPRLPLLLSPGKSEQFTFSLTTNVEMTRSLKYTIHLKDASIDGVMEQIGELQVDFKLPTIQAMSADGLNKVTYPPIPEKCSTTKSFVILSDCPADLQLKLSIVEGESLFCIKNVQEIKKSDINKVLLERRGSDDQASGKSKSKAMNKVLCRLTQGNAIKIAITFNSPRLADLQLSSETKVTFNGALNVNILSGDAVLKRIELVGTVGSPMLELCGLPEKIHLKNNEPIKITVKNIGTVTGSWSIKQRIDESNNFPFQASPTKFELQPGAAMTIALAYCGPEDSVNEATILFEENTTNSKVTLDLSGGTDKPKPFPIKTNNSILSWVRSGRKELSLKNTTDKKIYIRCQLLGEGFSIDLPGVESRGIYVLPFEAKECRPLPIVFAPTTLMPCSATLNLVYDKNTDTARKVKLFGCNSHDMIRWSGLVTYSDTALVRAASRMPVELRMYNKSPMPAFVAARVHFNLQYMSLESSATLDGAYRVIAGRSRHTIALRLDWSRVERRAQECATTALATVTVLTGAEFTRRRILKILSDESNGNPDTSLLPPHLKVLAGQFEGEDPNTKSYFKDFTENQTSLNELIGGLQELTAHIDLPQDYGDENTIIIADDTVIDHHTLIE